MIGALDVAALAQAYAGDTEVAALTAERAQRIAADDPLLSAWATYVRGELWLDDDPGSATELLEQALVEARANNDRYLAGVALVSAASGRARSGRPDEARALFCEVLQHWRAAGNWTQQWTTVRGVVNLLVQVGDDEAAAVLHGAVAGRPTATPLFGADAARLADNRRSLADCLGPAEFEQASTRGATLADDEVVTFACTALIPR